MNIEIDEETARKIVRMISDEMRKLAGEMRYALSFKSAKMAQAVGREQEMLDGVRKQLESELE